MKTFERTFFYLAIITIGLVQLLSIISLGDNEIIGTDLSAYLTGATIIRQGRGDDLYDVSVQTQVQRDLVGMPNRGLLPFRYLPVVGLIFIPLSIIPLTIAYKIFVVFNLVLLFIFNLLVLKIFPEIKKNKQMLLLPVVFLSVFFTMILGQTSMIILLVFLLFYYFLRQGNFIVVGMMFGMLFFKPQLWLALPFFLLLAGNKIRFLIGFFVTIVICLLISFWISGAETLYSYPSFLISTETVVMGSKPQWSVSLFYALKSTPIISDLSRNVIFSINFLAYLLTFWLFRKKHQKMTFPISFTIATISMVIFSIHGLVHDFVVLLVLFYLWQSQYYLIPRTERKIFVILFVLILLVPIAVIYINISTIAYFLLGFVIYIICNNKAYESKN